MVLITEWKPNMSTFTLGEFTAKSLILHDIYFNTNLYHADAVFIGREIYFYSNAPAKAFPPPAEKKMGTRWSSVKKK